MITPSNQRLIVIGLYVNAVLLAAGVIALCTRSSIPSFLPAAYGQNQGTIGGGAGVFIVPAQFATNNYGCYLLDIDAQTICAYQFFPGKPELTLMAARNFRYDRQLKNFNAGTPAPAEVMQMIERQNQPARVGQPDQPK